MDYEFWVGLSTVKNKIHLKGKCCYKMFISDHMSCLDHAPSLTPLRIACFEEYREASRGLGWTQNSLGIQNNTCVRRLWLVVVFLFLLCNSRSSSVALIALLIVAVPPLGVVSAVCVLMASRMRRAGSSYENSRLRTRLETCARMSATVGFVMLILLVSGGHLYCKIKARRVILFQRVLTGNVVDSLLATYQSTPVYVSVNCTNISLVDISSNTSVSVEATLPTVLKSEHLLFLNEMRKRLVAAPNRNVLEIINTRTAADDDIQQRWKKHHHE